MPQQQQDSWVTNSCTARLHWRTAGCSNVSSTQESHAHDHCCALRQLVSPIHLSLHLAGSARILGSGPRSGVHARAMDTDMQRTRSPSLPSSSLSCMLRSVFAASRSRVLAPATLMTSRKTLNIHLPTLQSTPHNAKNSTMPLTGAPHLPHPGRRWPASPQKRRRMPGPSAIRQYCSDPGCDSDSDSDKITAGPDLRPDVKISTTSMLHSVGRASPLGHLSASTSPRGTYSFLPAHTPRLSRVLQVRCMGNGTRSDVEAISRGCCAV